MGAGWFVFYDLSLMVGVLTMRSKSHVRYVFASQEVLNVAEDMVQHLLIMLIASHSSCAVASKTCEVVVVVG